MLYTIYSSHAPRRGFSLIEMLVVVSIVAIFASVVVQSFRTGAAEARDAQRKAILQELAQAAELFHARTGCYPSDIGGRDSSNGWGGSGASTRTGTDDWHPSSGLRELEQEGILNQMPVDPLNTRSHFIYYEPHCALGDSFNACKQGFTLGVRLESTGQRHVISMGRQAYIYNDSGDNICAQYCGFTCSGGACC